MIFHDIIAICLQDCIRQTTFSGHGCDLCDFENIWYGLLAIYYYIELNGFFFDLYMCQHVYLEFQMNNYDKLTQNK